MRGEYKKMNQAKRRKITMNTYLKTAKKLRRALCIVLALVLFAMSAPLTSAAEEPTGPYGVMDDYTYEDYLTDLNSEIDVSDRLKFSEADWDQVVTLSYEYLKKIVKMNSAGEYHMDWATLNYLLLMADFKPQGLAEQYAAAAEAGGTAAASKGPYGAEDYTYEDYVSEIENSDDYIAEQYILDRYDWDSLVAYTHDSEQKIIREAPENGEYELDWLVFPRVVEDHDEKALSDASWESWDNLSYDEKMESMRRDMEIQDYFGEQAAAREAAEAAAHAAQPITLKVNGTVVPTDSPPVMENGRTLAPLRAVVESLGYIAAWDGSTQTIGVYDYYTEALIIEMRIGSNVARVAIGSGISSVFDDRTLDAPAKLINGRTMVPVRFIAETLGCTVQWDEASKTVNIAQAAG
jgi:hypothetical protein